MPRRPDSSAGGWQQNRGAAALQQGTVVNVDAVIHGQELQSASFPRRLDVRGGRHHRSEPRRADGFHVLQAVYRAVGRDKRSSSSPTTLAVSINGGAMPGLRINGQFIADGVQVSPHLVAGDLPASQVYGGILHSYPVGAHLVATAHPDTLYTTPFRIMP